MKSNVHIYKTFFRTLILLISVALIPHHSEASHFGGGEINYRCLGFSEYEVSVIVYIDCSGAVPFTALPLFYQSASCGNGVITLQQQGAPQEVSPLCPAVLSASSCSGGGYPGVRKIVYMDTLVLPGNCTDWFLYYDNCCRNSATTNINNPTGTNIMLSAELDNLSYLCNSNPRFLNPGVAFAQGNQPFVYDPHAIDDDGDELRFRLTSAMQSPTVPVFYNGGFSPTQPILETFILDSLNGRISFTPTAAPGDYIITYRVEEYRNGTLVGATLREVKITYFYAGLHNNNPPTFATSNITGGVSAGDSIFICAGQPLSFDVTVTDADATDSIHLTYYDVQEVTTGATFTATGVNPVTGTFNWNAPLGGVYKVGFIVQDPNCPITASHQLFNVTIFVQSPGPVLGITDQFLCSSPNITITAGGTFGSYIWNTGDTTSSIVVDTAGVYCVTTTGACGTFGSCVEIFDDPQVEVFGSNSDTVILVGDSIQLFATLGNGLASDLFFCENTAHAIPAGGVTTVPMSVSNIFPTILDTGSVVDVCLDISQAYAGDLDVYLVAPNGAMITMTTNNGSTGNFQNTCFSINATDLITNYNASAIPSDSSFIPQGSWDHFYGGTAASQWQLAIRHDSVGNPDGILNKFSIQFGGGYDYNWTPNYNMSCADCSNPFVWPDTTTSYVVEMTDGANCTTYDTITVIVLQPMPTDTLYYDVAEDSSLLICADLPVGMGPFTSATVLTAPNHGTLTAGYTYNAPTFCYEYNATSSPQVNDTVTVVFCDQHICDTTVFIVTTVSCVWAGDTDTDQQVNNFDLLPIGLGHGQTGAVRPNADLNFDCEPHQDWGTATPVTMIDYKHSDCDGNGIVNGQDTAAIIQNWGQFYIKNGTASSSNAVPFYTDYYQTVEGATIQVPIMLGDSANTVDSAYGVAFTINYDETLVDSGSVFVSFSPSWMGTLNNDMISVNKDFYQQGQVHAAVTRIDQTHRNGAGQIGFIQMTIKDDIIKKSANIHLNMHIDNVRLITDQEVEISTVPVYTYVLILDPLLNNPTITTETAELTIFPNPSSSIVHLQSNNASIQEVQVFSATGQEVLHQFVDNERSQFSVQNLTAGMYVVRVQTDKGLFNRRILVRH